MNFEQDFILVDIDTLFTFLSINERICKIGVKLKYYTLILTSTHAPTERKDEAVLWKRYEMQ